MIPQRKGDPIEFKADEGIRADTTAESWPACARPSPRTAPSPPAGLADLRRRRAVVVMSKAKAEEISGLTWLAEIGAHGVVAGPDSTLQSQPAEAIKAACAKEGITPADLDLRRDQRGLRRGRPGLRQGARRRRGQGQPQRRRHRPRPPGRHVRRPHHPAPRQLELQRRGGVGAAALCGGGGQGDALIVRVPAQA
jgi:acetyl-CoA C-acetyltransferase